MTDNTATRWCAKHKHGWCALLIDAPPATREWEVRTLCEYWITLPLGYEQRIPDCPECIARMTAALDTPANP